MSNDHDDRPVRDANGRWLKGHCPNPKGRPRKTVKSDFDLGDLRHFGNTLIDVMAGGEKMTMVRSAALLHKMFESAMKGKVSQQRFLYKEFERNAKQLAASRVHYDELLTEWIIDNPEFGGPDFEIPFRVEVELEQLKHLLNHYFPNDYPLSVRSAGKDRSEVGDG